MAITPAPSSAAMRAPEIERALLHGQSSGHLAHRRQQRQAPVGPLHRLVGDGDHTGAAQRARQLRRRRQVQVREEDLAGAQTLVLLRHRLLDLENELRAAPDVLHAGEFGADVLELVVADAAAEPGTLLNEHRVAGLAEGMAPGGREGDALLARLDLARDADDHPRSSVSAASISVSESVGCVWMVSARSSASSAASTASAASAMSSPAPAPAMPAPSRRPDSGSTISFVTPSLRPSVAARPDAAHWNFATRTARPSVAAWVSVRPHQAISGSVKTTAGTTALSNAAGRPAIASAATLPWRMARWASIGSPVASPTAKIRGSAGAPRRTAFRPVAPPTARGRGRRRVAGRRSSPRA